MSHTTSNTRRAITVALGFFAGALAFTMGTESASAQCNPVNRVSEALIPADPPPRDRIDAIFIRLNRSPQLYELLGCPVDYFGTSKDGGAFLRMERGMIYAPPGRPAVEIHGGILDKWGEYNWEWGALGYVTGDEMDWQGVGRYNAFEKGMIVWSADFGAHAIYAPFQDAFLSHAPKMLPTSEQATSKGVKGNCPQSHKQQNFWNPGARRIEAACYDANTRRVTWIVPPIEVGPVIPNPGWTGTLGGV